MAQPFICPSHSQADDLDIMVAYKDDEGIWSTVEKLPSEVNSSGREHSPFIHDGTTLYFVSERSPSIGGPISSWPKAFGLDLVGT